MIKQYYTWSFIHAQLTRGKAVMLLYVLESIGSSPGRAGFFMGVTSDGEMAGSIGGGIMEHKFVELAKELLTNDGSFIGIRRQIHNKEVARDQSGMICSGEQTIALYRLSPADTETVGLVTGTLKRNENGILHLSNKGISFEQGISSNTQKVLTRSGESEWEYSEMIGFQNVLHIVGGGHCALALSQLMALSGFYIVVYDDRKNLHTLGQNCYAHSIKEVKEYSELAECLIIGTGIHYAVVMTFGYRTDAIALRAIMGKRFAYLGLLGSQHKIGEMMAEFKTEGIDESILRSIHAPAGIRINSREPEEIAISIAAEIISVKNKPL